MLLVGTGIKHSVTVTEAVAVQIYKLLCGKDQNTASLFAQWPTRDAGVLHYHRVATLLLPASPAVIYRL
eukprot:4548148-Pleurochrysis_carterae.AAC.1